MGHNLLVSVLNSLSLSFLVCKMGLEKPTWEGVCED